MANYTGQVGVRNRHVGTSDSDTFRYATENLDGDTIIGGLGRDTLQVTTAGIVAADALANVSGVEVFVFAAGDHAITVLDANFTDVADSRITIYGNAGNDTIDASGLTGDNAITFRSGSGLDVLKGGAGADWFAFSAANLDGDTLIGGGGIDRLILRSAGTLTRTALANVNGIEQWLLASGTNSVTIADANLADVIGSRLAVFGGSDNGDDFIDASGLTGSNAVLVNSRGGRDVMLGGAGNDIFRFLAADLNGDTIQGGAGYDLLQIYGAGTVSNTAIDRVRGVEGIQLTTGTNAITLTDAMVSSVTGSRITVNGGGGNDTIDASGLTGINSVVLSGGAGLDTLKGGAGDDEFQFAADDLNRDTIDGGGGQNVLRLTTAGTVNGFATANMRGVGTIILADGTNDFDIGWIGLTSAPGRMMKIIGSNGDDTITAGRSESLGSFDRIDVTAGGGLDSITGTDADDTFRFAGGDLDADLVRGKFGQDTLIISSGGVSSAAALTKVTGIETIVLADAANSLVFTDSNFTGTSGKITVTGGSGDDTVDGSALTAHPVNPLYGNILDITAGGGLDVLKGGASNDIFRFALADLDGDTVQGGAGSDRLVVTGAGTITTTMLANVNGIESIELANGTNSVTLSDDQFASVTGAKIAVVGNAGNDTIDGSALTGSNALDITGGGGVDVLKGGAGDDTFRVDLSLLALNTVIGGAGTDVLQLRTAGIFTSSSLRNVDVEIIKLANGANSFRAEARGPTNLTIIGGSGDDSLDASLHFSTLYTYNFNGGAGNDLIWGGRSDDVLEGGAGADTITGGTGIDRFVWTSKLNGGDTIVDYRSNEDKLTFSAEAFTVRGAFDSIEYNRGAGTNLSNADMLDARGSTTYDTAADVRALVDTMTSSNAHGMFVMVNNSAGKLVLYYTSDASTIADSGLDKALYHIADLAAGPAMFDPINFVFI